MATTSIGPRGDDRQLSAHACLHGWWHIGQGRRHRERNDGVVAVGRCLRRDRADCRIEDVVRRRYLDACGLARLDARQVCLREVGRHLDAP